LKTLRTQLHSLEGSFQFMEMEKDISEIYFESYGCSANHNSTEIMKGLVKSAGLNITTNINYADLIVINSCIVKEPTEEKIRRQVQDLLKERKKVILAGCMPNLRKKSFIQNNLYMLDTSHIKDITNIIIDIKNNTYDQEKYLKKRNEIKLGLPKIPQEKIISITQISEGCLGECSFCITKLAKGKLFSYPQENIIESIKRDISAGCKEVWITSQDNSAYGKDLGGYLLPELIQEILELPGKFFVRIGMMNPDNVLKILDELIKIYKRPKMFKFLHIPIQSGSNNILKAMKRKYTKEDVLRIIDKFKKEIPDITIATDIIVGFPGETEKDWQETIDILNKINPEILNKSNYGIRPGTEAEKLNSKEISAEIMKSRAIELSDLHLNICNKIQNKFIGKTFEVLIDKKGFENTWIGRNNCYKLFAVPSDKNLIGKIVKVKVKKTTPHYLIGEVV